MLRNGLIKPVPTLTALFGLVNIAPLKVQELPSDAVRLHAAARADCVTMVRAAAVLSAATHFTIQPVFIKVLQKKLALEIVLLIHSFSLFGAIKRG